MYLISNGWCGWIVLEYYEGVLVWYGLLEVLWFFICL